MIGPPPSAKRRAQAWKREDLALPIEDRGKLMRLTLHVRPWTLELGVSDCEVLVPSNWGTVSITREYIR